MLSGQLGASQLGALELGGGTVNVANAPAATPAPTIQGGPPIPGAPWATLRLVPLLAAPPLPVAPLAGTRIYDSGISGGPPIPGAPWRKRWLDRDAYGYNPVPPVVPPQQPYAPPITGGPPIPGAPWFRPGTGEPRVAVPLPVAPLAGVQIFALPISGGPPIPGAPWGRAQAPGPQAAPGPGGTVIVPVTPHPEFPTTDLPTLARDPKADPRLRRFTEIVATLVNSLMGQGFIQQTGAASYVLHSGGFVEHRPPGPTDDASIGVNPGCSWVDLTGGSVYFCIKNSIGSAVWKGPF